MKTLKDFRVLAIVTAFNEADIIGDTTEYLNAQGIDICLIDNHSTDWTIPVMVRKDNGNGYVTKGGSKDKYDWWTLLKKVENSIEHFQHDYDWIIHHDCDERRTSPWIGKNYKEGLYIVDQQEYNLINHQVVEFRPTDNDFKQGDSLEDYFQYVDPAAKDTCNNVQLKAWKTGDYKVDLKSTGGHEARFPNRKVFPHRFILKHYPIRSQEHGERKIFKERKERYAQSDLQRGWHIQYRGIKPGHSFIKDKEDLVLWRDEDYKRVLER
jgi:hypothetical protein